MYDLEERTGKFGDNIIEKSSIIFNKNLNIFPLPWGEGQGEGTAILCLIFLPPSC